MNTLKLIENLKIELQKFGEKLAEIFPERIKRLSDQKFSEIWGINVNKLKVRLRKGSGITKSAIDELYNNVYNLLGEKGGTCLKLIRKCCIKLLFPVPVDPQMNMCFSKSLIEA